MNGQQKPSNDSHGLVGKWQIVPKEGPRPQSAIEYDRKSEPIKTNPDYGNQLFAYIEKMSKRRAEKKRASQEASAESNSQIN